MKLLVVSSSIREQRNTHKVAKAVNKIAQQLGYDTQLLDLKEFLLPQYGAPKSDEAAQQIEIVGNMQKSADAMIFVTPEYNGSFSSALKSMIDYYPKSNYQNKVIGVATVSTGGMAGMRAAQNLQLQILALFAYPNPNMLLTGTVNSKFDENDDITDEAYLEKVTDFVNTIMKQTELLRA